jgi:hypothetical protein
MLAENLDKGISSRCFQRALLPEIHNLELRKIIHTFSWQPIPLSCTGYPWEAYASTARRRKCGAEPGSAQKRLNKPLRARPIAAIDASTQKKGTNDKPPTPFSELPPISAQHTAASQCSFRFPHFVVHRP